MKNLLFVVLVALFVFLPLKDSSLSAQNPLNLDTLPTNPNNVNRNIYRKLTPEEVQSGEDPTYYTQGSELPFDKNGMREFEGFIYEINDKVSPVEFKIHTAHNGTIKAKLARNTNYIPSSSAFKDGAYALIKQYRNLNVTSIEIPAIWDAKKRDGWHEFDEGLK